MITLRVYTGIQAGLQVLQTCLPAEKVGGRRAFHFPPIQTLDLPKGCRRKYSTHSLTPCQREKVKQHWGTIRTFLQTFMRWPYDFILQDPCTFYIDAVLLWYPGVQTRFARVSAHKAVAMPEDLKLQTPWSSYLWAAAAVTAPPGRSGCGTGKSPGISSASGPFSSTSW